MEACNFVADAMLESARDVDPTAAIALMNVGGIRADIPFAGTGDVTFGDLYTALPFGNRLVLVTLSGADLIAALDEAATSATARPLCPSGSLTYSWRFLGGTAPGTVLVDGVPVDRSASYRVVVNDYNFAGGEGYTVFQERGTSASATPLLLVGAAERFLEARSPYTPDTTVRVTTVP